MSDPNEENNQQPNKKGKYSRAAITALGGAIPFVGGFVSAASNFWNEAEQEQMNKLLLQWRQMLEDELREKGKAIAEIAARLDLKDKETIERIESSEYQSILKKAFCKWSTFNSEAKQEKIRNILSNAAGSGLASDDVVKLFIDWIAEYSDFHFEVIGEIYRKEQIGRGSIWSSLGRPSVREDSTAGLFY